MPITIVLKQETKVKVLFLTQIISRFQQNIKGLAGKRNNFFVNDRKKLICEVDFEGGKRYRMSKRKSLGEGKKGIQNWGLEFKRFSLLNNIFTYNIKLMSNKKKQQNYCKKIKWSDEEKNLLVQLKPRFSSKKWKHIAEEFKNRGFQRSQVECREKWVNELNPTVCKTSWTTSELEILFQTYSLKGSHWSLIEKKLKGRSQNMIKNKFYSLLRNIVRFILRNFHQNAEDTKKILNTLSTKCLQNIYLGKEEYTFLGNLIERNFQQMKFTIDRKLLRQIFRKNELQFRHLFNIIKKIQINQSEKEVMVKLEEEEGEEEKISSENSPIESSEHQNGMVKMEEKPAIKTEERRENYYPQFFPQFLAYDPSYWYYPSFNNVPENYMGYPYPKE